MLKVLAGFARLNTIKERIKEKLSKELVSRLLNLFSLNPVNNFIHCELTKLLVSLMFLANEKPQPKTRESIHQTFVNRLHYFVTLFEDKQKSSHMLFKAHLSFLVSSLADSMQEAGVKLLHLKAKTDVLWQFAKKQEEVNNNSLFNKRQRHSSFSVEFDADNLRSDRKCVEELVNKRTRTADVGEDDRFEAVDQNFVSQHPGINPDILKDLILKINQDEVLTPEEEQLNEAIEDYQVNLDLDDDNGDNQVVIEDRDDDRPLVIPIDDCEKQQKN